MNSKILMRIVILTGTYGLIYFVADCISAGAQIPTWTAGTILILYLLALTYYLCSRKLLREYRISRIFRYRRFSLHIVLLLLFPICNLILQVTEGGITFSSFAMMPMLIAAAFGEELLFRGVFPPILFKGYACTKVVAAIISSGLFALLHFSDFFNGVDIETCGLQIAVAFLNGVSLCALTDGTGSIIPAVLLHILINFTAMPYDFSVCSRPEIILVLIVSVPAFCFSLWMYLKEGDSKNETLY